MDKILQNLPFVNKLIVNVHEAEPGIGLVVASCQKTGYSTRSNSGQIQIPCKKKRYQYIDIELYRLTFECITDMDESWYRV